MLSDTPRGPQQLTAIFYHPFGPSERAGTWNDSIPHTRHSRYTVILTENRRSLPGSGSIILIVVGDGFIKDESCWDEILKIGNWERFCLQSHNQ